MQLVSSGGRKPDLHVLALKFLTIGDDKRKSDEAKSIAKASVETNKIKYEDEQRNKVKNDNVRLLQKIFSSEQDILYSSVSKEYRKGD
ncbi:hypothetical protein TNCV_4478041 [Trichonephila clavipes]|nr:hypothetical protein TNCV_4478041 [Trichonephila clavipes]